jgi:hypothetical protein
MAGIMHLLIEILRNSILITGLVVVMMMMIESLNIESRGLFFKGLRKTRTGQVVIAALLGSVPGCMGGFATVSLYTHRMFSFGALTAMMIASSGDEAFIMLAMIPQQSLIIFAVLFVLAVITGIVVDMIWDRKHSMVCAKHDHSGCGPETECTDGYEIHDEMEKQKGKKRSFGWHRIVMFIGLAIFIAALATGKLGHDHSAHGHEDHEGHIHTEACVHEHGDCTHEHEDAAFHIDLLSEDWMNVLFAGLSIIMLFVLILASDHFVEGHLWNHIVKKHLPVIFAWTFGVLLILGILIRHIDISSWISDNTLLMIFLAALIGIIPESGPHMIFVTLYAAGVVPLPVLLASCISQDGHASIPLLAESKKSFLWAKIINCAVAVAAGLVAMIFV